MCYSQAAAVSTRRLGGMDGRHFLSYLSDLPDLSKFLQ